VAHLKLHKLNIYRLDNIRKFAAELPDHFDRNIGEYKILSSDFYYLRQGSLALVEPVAVPELPLINSTIKLADGLIPFNLSILENGNYNKIKLYMNQISEVCVGTSPGTSKGIPRSLNLYEEGFEVRPCFNRAPLSLLIKPLTHIATINW